MQLALLVAAVAVCSPVLQAAQLSPTYPIYRTTGRCVVSSIVCSYTYGMLATFMSCPLQSDYHTCTYKYYATQRNFDKAELQVTEVQAIVHISCSSGEC